MTQDEFNEVLNTQLERVRDILEQKADEYAPTADKLHNFKTVAALKRIPMVEAVSGMMVKHTVSIYDMIDMAQSHSMAKWDEKITDHINYLILLKACLIEEGLQIEKDNQC